MDDGMTPAGETTAAELAATWPLGVGGEALCLRGFRLLPAARMLLHRGRPVAIGSRAFDVLLVLLRARGTVVPREEMFRQVWPRTTVEESNLRFQVACVRRVLGEDRDLLKTVPGRGYLLAAEIPPEPSEAGTAGPAAARPEVPPMLRDLVRVVLEEVRAAGAAPNDRA